MLGPYLSVSHFTCFTSQIFPKIFPKMSIPMRFKPKTHPTFLWLGFFQGQCLPFWDGPIDKVHGMTWALTNGLPMASSPQVCEVWPICFIKSKKTIKSSSHSNDLHDQALFVITIPYYPYLEVSINGAIPNMLGL